MTELVPLDKFLLMLQSDLQEAVANIDRIVPERKDIHYLVKDAWKELQPQFETARATTHRIGLTDVSTFRAKGLAGAQLTLKIEEFRWHRESFISAFDRFKHRIEDVQAIAVKRLLKGLLVSADNILDTLASIVPVVQAIKEFKDTLVSIMSD